MKFFQLIGTQRSGSNLFRLMLNEFDDVFAPHPPHLLKTFINLLPKYNSLQNDNDARRLVKDMIKWIQFNPVPWNYIPNVDEVIKQSKENSIFNFFEKIYVLGAKNASKKNINLMPFIIEAIESKATLGEISDALRDIFGVHQ